MGGTETGATSAEEPHLGNNTRKEKREGPRTSWLDNVSVWSGLDWHWRRQHERQLVERYGWRAVYDAAKPRIEEGKRTGQDGLGRDETMYTVSKSIFVELVFYSNFVPTSHSFWDIRLQKMSRPWNPGQRSLKVIGTDTGRPWWLRVYGACDVCVCQRSRAVGANGRGSDGGIRQLVHGRRVSTGGRRQTVRTAGQPRCRMQRHLAPRPDVSRSSATADVRSSARWWPLNAGDLPRQPDWLSLRHCYLYDRNVRRKSVIPALCTG